MSELSATTGFNDPVHESQIWFRSLLEALSRPGIPVSSPAKLTSPDAMGSATAGIALSLFDPETTIWLDQGLGTEDVEAFLRLHTGAVIVEKSSAASFALVSDPASMPPISTFALGSASFPDRSATIIIQLPSLDGGRQMELSGPGIEGLVAVSPAGLPESFWDQWNDNARHFPMGVDLLLTDGDRIIGIPRTSRRA